MKGMKLRFLSMGIILIALSLYLHFIRGIGHAAFILTGIGAVFFILGLIWR